MLLQSAETCRKIATAQKYPDSNYDHYSIGDWNIFRFYFMAQQVSVSLRQ